MSGHSGLEGMDDVPSKRLEAGVVKKEIAYSRTKMTSNGCGGARRVRLKRRSVERDVEFTEQQFRDSS